jgi:hypothetical protein
LDAARKAMIAQPDNALLVIRIALGIGRSIGDDPSPAAQQFRLETRHLAFESIQRVLRWGMPTKEALQQTQALLENEVGQPVLLYAVRGQRALAHEALLKIETTPGTPDAATLAALMIDPAKITPEQWQNVDWVKDNHAIIVETDTALVDLAALPPAERAAKFREIQASVTEMDGKPEKALAYAALAPMVQLAHDYLVDQAELQTAITALAAERFRLIAGRWPRAPGELQSKQLVAQPPIDPLDGEPIKIRPFDKSGLLVYSVGLDGKDDKGTQDRANRAKAGTDITFRLWHTTRRGPEKK